MPSFDFKALDSRTLEITEALRMQMEVQKRLHEQLYACGLATMMPMLMLMLMLKKCSCPALMVGVVAGVSDAINNGYGSWGPLFGKLFFAFWVIVHLYPFFKGLMGRQNRTPTIVVLWSILLTSIFSLVWVRIDPFLSKQTDPVLKPCGIEC